MGGKSPSMVQLCSSSTCLLCPAATLTWLLLELCLLSHRFERRSLLSLLWQSSKTTPRRCHYCCGNLQYHHVAVGSVSLSGCRLMLPSFSGIDCWSRLLLSDLLKARTQDGGRVMPAIPALDVSLTYVILPAHFQKVLVLSCSSDRLALRLPFQRDWIIKRKMAIKHLLFFLQSFLISESTSNPLLDHFLRYCCVLLLLFVSI